MRWYWRGALSPVLLLLLLGLAPSRSFAPTTLPLQRPPRWLPTIAAATAGSLSGEALADWKLASKGEATAAKSSVLQETMISDLLAEGEISPEEVEEIWRSRVGDGVEAADAVSFGSFWRGVDELFEIEEEEEEEEQIGTSRYEEIWLDSAARKRNKKAKGRLGESIGKGEVVLQMEGVATKAELRQLLAGGLAAASASGNRGSGGGGGGLGRSRFSVSDPQAFPDPEIVITAEEM